MVTLEKFEFVPSSILADQDFFVKVCGTVPSIAYVPDVSVSVDQNKIAISVSAEKMSDDLGAQVIKSFEEFCPISGLKSGVYHVEVNPEPLASVKDLVIVDGILTNVQGRSVSNYISLVTTMPLVPNYRFEILDVPEIIEEGSRESLITSPLVIGVRRLCIQFSVKKSGSGILKLLQGDKELYYQVVTI